jgi:hypothetical protein
MKALFICTVGLALVTGCAANQSSSDAGSDARHAIVTVADAGSDPSWEACEGCIVSCPPRGDVSCSGEACDGCVPLCAQPSLYEDPMLMTCGFEVGIPFHRPECNGVIHPGSCWRHVE